MTKILIISLLILNSLIAATGQLFYKFGVNDKSIVPIVFGLFFYGTSLLLWLFILSKVDLSYAYALTALTIVILLVLSRVFLHENYNLLRIVGSVIIVVGIIFVAKS